MKSLDKALKNHSGIDIKLEELTFLKLIREDQSRTGILEHLPDLFANPDEIWMNEYEKNVELIVYKYIKFFSNAAIFGIVDIMNPLEMKIIDFYYILADEYTEFEGERMLKIDAQRNGILTRRGPLTH